MGTKTERESCLVRPKIRCICINAQVRVEMGRSAESIDNSDPYLEVCMVQRQLIRLLA